MEGFFGDKILIALKGLAEKETQVSFPTDQQAPSEDLQKVQGVTRRAEVSADFAKVALPAAGKAVVLLLQR